MRAARRSAVAILLRWHVREGQLSYIVFGSGEERPRRCYHPDDVAAFVKSRTMRGEPTVARSKRGRRSLLKRS